MNTFDRGCRDHFAQIAAQPDQEKANFLVKVSPRSNLLADAVTIGGDYYDVADQLSNWYKPFTRVRVKPGDGRVLSYASKRF